MSEETAAFLETVGQALEPINNAVAALAQAGLSAGDNLDAQLVHLEQTEVQNQLDTLRQADAGAYDTAIAQINDALNPGMAADFLSSIFPTDRHHGNVLDGVRNDLGRNIDFSNQSDREAIGLALIKNIRESDGSSGCDVGGGMLSGC